MIPVSGSRFVSEVRLRVKAGEPLCASPDLFLADAPNCASRATRFTATVAGNSRDIAGVRDTQEAAVIDPAAVDETLDCVGLFCPEPLFQARAGMDELEVGQVLEVLADDPAAEEDLTRFAKRAGHEMVAVEDMGDYKRFLIRKGR
jgi:tRNA 2-thiouridine synthesizing protein A